MTSHQETWVDPQLNTAPQAVPSEKNARSLEPLAQASGYNMPPRCGPTCIFRTIPIRPTDTVSKMKPEKNVGLLDAIQKEMLHLGKHLYKPLQPRQTRLLRIFPGLPGQPLVCELEVVTINQRSKSVTCRDASRSHQISTYEALSYTWGITGSVARIDCNGKNIPVTQNLADALHHMRQADKERVIWADAVCINQCDDGERAQQVGCMLEIFQNAQSVIAWVGIASREDSAMLSFMNDLASSSLDKISRAEHGHECIVGLIRLHRWFAKFFSRRWFSRTWIRQEVYACDEIDIHCGNRVIAMQNLINGIDFIQQLDVDLSEYDRSCMVSSEMAILRFRHYVHHKSILKKLSETSAQHAEAESADRSEIAQLRNAYEVREWLRIILQGKLFSATDPRDKIYGIWKMLQDATQPNAHQPASQIELPISYAKPASIVYQDMMKLLINKGRNLEVLSCFFDRARYTSQAVPTWCLDLRVDYGGFSLTSTALGVGLAELQNLDACGCLALHGAILGSTGAYVDVDYMDEDLFTPELAELGDMGVYDPEGKRYIDGVQPFRTSDLYRTGYGLFTFQPLMNTNSKYFGSGSYLIMAPAGAKDGDVIVQAYGAFHPYALQPLEMGGESYHYCGPVVILQRKEEVKLKGARSKDSLDKESTADPIGADAATWTRWVMPRQTLEGRTLNNSQNFVLI